MSQEIRIVLDFIRLAAVPAPNVMSLWLSLMAGSILMRGHAHPWLTSWWHGWRAGGHEQMHDDVQQHRNAESSIQQRGQVPQPLHSGALPLCAFFYYQLVHYILFVKLHWCMCSGGDFFCLLINHRVQYTWIVVDNNISWQSYDY